MVTYDTKFNFSLVILSFQHLLYLKSRLDMLSLNIRTTFEASWSHSLTFVWFNIFSTFLLICISQSKYALHQFLRLRPLTLFDQEMKNTLWIIEIINNVFSYSTTVWKKSILKFLSKYCVVWSFSNFQLWNSLWSPKNARRNANLWHVDIT